MYLPTLDISYKWNRMIEGLLWLARVFKDVSVGACIGAFSLLWANILLPFHKCFRGETVLPESGVSYRWLISDSVCRLFPITDSDSDNQNPSPTQVRALLTTKLKGPVSALVCLLKMDVSWMIILNEVRQRKINTVWYRLYVESKTGHRWTYLWNRSRVTDVENTLVVARGDGGGERWSGIHPPYGIYPP